MRLRVLTGPNQSARLEIEGDACAIGCDDACCDLVLHDETLLPLHAVLRQKGVGEFELELYESAQAEVGGVVVSEGRHRVEPDRLFRLGASELVVLHEPELEEAEAIKPKPSLMARVAGSLSKAQWTAAVVGGIATATVSVPFAMHSLDINGAGNSRADPRQVQNVIASLELPALEVITGPQGVVVRGMVSTPIEIERIKAALNQGRLRNVRVEVSAPPPMVQYDARLQLQPANVRTLGSGVGVIDEGTKPVKPVSPPVKTPLRLIRIAANAPGGPYIEVADGQRFTLGATTSEGYVVSSITESFAILMRNDDRIVLTLQQLN